MKKYYIILTIVTILFIVQNTEAKTANSSINYLKKSSDGYSLRKVKDLYTTEDWNTNTNSFTIKTSPRLNKINKTNKETAPTQTFSDKETNDRVIEPMIKKIKKRELSEEEKLNIDNYMKNIELQAKKMWFPPKDNDESRVVIKFKIGLDGEILDYKIIESSNKENVDLAAVKAIKMAAPYKSTIPEDVLKISEFILTFETSPVIYNWQI